MSTKREVFEGQTAVCRVKLRKGGSGSFPGNFQNPVLQMVQSELFLSDIYEYSYPIL